MFPLYLFYMKKKEYYGYGPDGSTIYSVKLIINTSKLNLECHISKPSTKKFLGLVPYPSKQIIEITSENLIKFKNYKEKDFEKYAQGKLGFYNLLQNQSEFLTELIQDFNEEKK